MQLVLVEEVLSFICTIGVCVCVCVNQSRQSQRRTRPDNYSTVRGDGGGRVGEVRVGTTSPMPEHKGLSRGSTELYLHNTGNVPPTAFVRYFNLTSLSYVTISKPWFF